MKVRKKAVLCAILAGIMLSTATPSLKLTVFADSAITETEALDKAVALYEHLTDKEVEIPQGLDETGLDTNLIKPIVLGYINFEDTEEAKQEKSITKQDFMTILYKTIITYNDSYTIYEDEANSILNECYDNAYIDDENRIACVYDETRHNYSKIRYRGTKSLQKKNVKLLSTLYMIILHKCNGDSRRKRNKSRCECQHNS